MYGNPSSAYEYVWALRRILQLSPMQKLIRELKRRGVRLSQMDALEIFGADGMRHTIDYSRFVRSLEIWEFDAGYLPGLGRHFPNARIRITDSFKEMQCTSRRFDLVVSDEPGQVFGPNKEYCEHFDFLPNLLFRIMRPDALIILNVVPEPLRQLPHANTLPTYRGYIERRREFYQVDHPDCIRIEEMIPAYRRVVEENGFVLEWHAHVQRTLRGGVHYLALKVRQS